MFNIIVTQSAGVDQKNKSRSHALRGFSHLVYLHNEFQAMAQTCINKPRVPIGLFYNDAH